MSEVDRLWAGWRSEYVSSGGATGTASRDSCVFCELLASKADPKETNIVFRNETVAVLLNAYPYGTGHTLVMPVRHVGALDALSEEESLELWKAINKTAAAINAAYNPNGLNIGFNLGHGSGAGIPDHLHAHVLPRWRADTNFLTSVANARVLPEALDVTWTRIHDAWPA